MIEHFDAYFADFGIAVTLSGGGVLSGIFDNGYAEAVSGFAAGSSPSVWLADTEAAQAPIGDQVTINATAYTVVGHEPDGTGLTRLLLRR